MKPKLLLFLGLFLLLVSAYPLFLMAVEVIAGHYAYERYQVTVIDEPTVRFGSHEITTDHNHVPPRILIDGRDYTSSNATETCLFAYLDDTVKQQRFVSITQPEPRQTYRDLHYRILLVPATGPVREELFHMNHRVSPIYRALLVRRIHPSPLGFYSQVFSVWPSLLYPLILHTPLLPRLRQLILLKEFCDLTSKV